MICKILHVKDTDGSNRVLSEIDSKVKIFDFLAFPSIQPYFNGLVLFFPRQIDPSPHCGPLLEKFLVKKFLLKIIVSPLHMAQIVIIIYATYHKRDFIL